MPTGIGNELRRCRVPSNKASDLAGFSARVWQNQECKEARHDSRMDRADINYLLPLCNRCLEFLLVRLSSTCGIMFTSDLMCLSVSVVVLTVCVSLTCVSQFFLLGILASFFFYCFICFIYLCCLWLYK